MRKRSPPTMDQAFWIHGSWFQCGEEAVSLCISLAALYFAGKGMPEHAPGSQMHSRTLCVVMDVGTIIQFFRIIPIASDKSTSEGL